MISINQLRKEYGEKVALNIPQLTINQGESVGIVGNNGAGKTTLFNLVLDLIYASNGEVLSKGEKVAGSEHWKVYTTAYIDHQFLIDFLTPYEYFYFLGSNEGLSKEETDILLDKYNYFISEDMRSDTYIRDLSKGNKTRVGIVGALIGNPEVLIFDEPFSSLDPSSQMQLRELFIQLNKEGKTLLISSHDLEHVSEVANRILIIKSGEITGDLTGAEIDLSKLRSYFIDEVKQEDAAIIEASQSSSESKSEGEENE